MSGPIDPSSPGPQQPPEEWNIGGAAADQMAQVLQTVQADPEIAVNEVQGDPAQPTLVVVEMTEDRANRLKTELGGNAIVERNIRFDPADPGDPFGPFGG